MQFFKQENLDFLTNEKNCIHHEILWSAMHITQTAHGFEQILPNLLNRMHLYENLIRFDTQFLCTISTFNFQNVDWAFHINYCSGEQRSTNSIFTLLKSGGTIVTEQHRQLCRFRSLFSHFYLFSLFSPSICIIIVFFCASTYFRFNFFKTQHVFWVHFAIFFRLLLLRFDFLWKFYIRIVCYVPLRNLIKLKQFCVVILCLTSFRLMCQICRCLSDLSVSWN